MIIQMIVLNTQVDVSEPGSMYILLLESIYCNRRSLKKLRLWRLESQRSQRGSKKGQHLPRFQYAVVFNARMAEMASLVQPDARIKEEVIPASFERQMEVRIPSLIRTWSSDVGICPVKSVHMPSAGARQ
jgi:hypothetical protein